MAIMKYDENVYVYLTHLPAGIREMVTPCDGGYTVYIDDRLDQAGRREAYRHAVRHIARDDFVKGDVQEIEIEARKEAGTGGTWEKLGRNLGETWEKWEEKWE